METARNDQFDDDTEKKGLGTPATRAGIIEKLVKSGFAERKGKSLIPTKDGCNLVCVLPEQISSPAMTRVQGIRRTISFRDQYGRAVETDVGDDHALRECSDCRVLMVDRLCDAYEIFLGIMVRFQLLDAADSFQPFQFLL